MGTRIQWRLELVWSAAIAIRADMAADAFYNQADRASDSTCMGT